MTLYDDGYKVSSCFWGKDPAFLVKDAVFELKRRNIQDPLKAIDLGCGEGKNTSYIATSGINVVGVDQSEFAIKNANANWKHLPNIFLIGDMRYIRGAEGMFDLVVSTGSIHCLENDEDVIKVINNIKHMLKIDGLVVFSAFNDRTHNFSGHSETFNPILLSHKFYVNMFSDMKIIHESDKDLKDIHPNNNIEHHHSITRIMAQKI